MSAFGHCNVRQIQDVIFKLVTPSKGGDTVLSELCGLGMELECDSSGQWLISAIRPGGPVDLSRRIQPGDTLMAIEWNQVQVPQFRQVFSYRFHNSSAKLCLR